MKEETEQCKGGDCVFCNSVCPECGSRNISVQFVIGYQYHNNKNSKLILNHSGTHLKGRCNECSHVFEGGDFLFDNDDMDDDSDENEFGLGFDTYNDAIMSRDKAADKLISALVGYFGSQVRINHNDDDNRISTERWVAKWQTIDPREMKGADADGRNSTSEG
jgi:hypothetical protein